jgi:4-amino-4-deoxy-L-arabinose transferase-like glycosyltransferase
MWTTLGLYGLLRHLLLGPSWGWYITGFAAMGLGIITKGVGFLPILVFIPYGYVRLRHWPHLPILRGDWRYWLAGPAAMLATISLWLAPMLMAVAASGDPALEAYRDNILWHQTAERYANPWHHFEPVWFLFAQALVLWLPVTILLPWLVPAWWRRLHRGDARYLLLLGWIALVLLFFSASAAQRGVYILPATTALALVSAPLITGLWHKAAAQSAAWVATFIIVAVFVGVGLLVACSRPAEATSYWRVTVLSLGGSLQPSAHWALHTALS